MEHRVMGSDIVAFAKQLTIRVEMKKKLISSAKFNSKS